MSGVPPPLPPSDHHGRPLPPLPPPALPQGKSYEGQAFHPELPGGKAKGRITVSKAGVLFQAHASAANVLLPISRLSVERGGATGDQVLIKHPSFPEWTLYSGEEALFKEPAFAALPGVKRYRGKIRRRTGCLLFGCLTFILLLVGLIYGLFWLREPVVAAAARKVPPEWEQKLGDLAFNQIKASTPMMDDPALLAQLDKIAQPIFDAVPADEKRHPFKLHIAADDVPNAFAVPGGNVVVNSGLIKMADRPEEVAGVLAHEIAHVTKQHSVRTLISRAGLALLIQAAFGDVTGLGAIVVEGSEFLLSQSYSRGYEREADEAGWEYLSRADVDPRGLTSFFEKLRASQGTSGKSAEAALEVLSTHPATGARIDYLNDKWKKQDKKEGFRKLDLDFAAFQKAVAQAAANKAKPGRPQPPALPKP